MIKQIIVIAVIGALGACAGSAGAGPTDTSESEQPAPRHLVAVSEWSNGGFEQQLAGWDFKRGWNDMTDQLLRKAIEIKRDRATALEASHYLRVSNPDGDRFFALTHDVKWQADTAYVLSWWMRGRAAELKNERGNVRLRIANHGGSEYPGQFSYDLDEWTYFQMPLYASKRADGQVQLWVWPEGWCEFDAVTLRRAFWQPTSASVTIGQPIRFELRIPLQESMRQSGRPTASVAYQIETSDGQRVDQGRLRGSLPYHDRIAMDPDVPGYYRLVSRTRLHDVAGTDDRGGDDSPIIDRVGVAVINPVDGIEAIRQQWR